MKTFTLDEQTAISRNPGGCGVYTLAERAKQADGLTDNEDIDAEDFGRDLAMQAMGGES